MKLGEKLIYLVLLLLVSCFFKSVAFADVTITETTGGTNLSADTCNLSFTNLEGLKITESIAGEIRTGNIVLNAPTGYVFNTEQDVTATIEGNIDLGAGPGVIQTATPLSGTITFSVLASSSNVSSITFSNIQIMPTNCVVPNSGNLYFNGTAGVSGGAGNLTIVSGVLDKFKVTITPEAGLTGASLTTTITVQDQHGNTTVDGFSEDVALTTDQGALIYPDTILNSEFTNGVWNGYIFIDNIAAVHTVTATGNGKTGNDTVDIGLNKITNLKCQSSGQTGAIWLSWIEPAQPVNGMFTGYVVKYSTMALSDSNWNKSTSILYSQSWAPAPAQGSATQQLITGLNPGTHYYFGVKLGKEGDTIGSFVSGTTTSCMAPASSSEAVTIAPPASHITYPSMNQELLAGQPIHIQGTARAAEGSSIQKVELSIDNSEWIKAQVTDNVDQDFVWEYIWSNPTVGEKTLRTRAYDWVNNIEESDDGIKIRVVSELTEEVDGTESNSGVESGNDSNLGILESLLPHLNPQTAQEIGENIIALQTYLISLLSQLITSLLPGA